MDIETYNRRENMLKLREELLAVEEDRLAGRCGWGAATQNHSCAAPYHFYPSIP